MNDLISWVLRFGRQPCRATPFTPGRALGLAPVTPGAEARHEFAADKVMSENKHLELIERRLHELLRRVEGLEHKLCHLERRLFPAVRLHLTLTTHQRGIDQMDLIIDDKTGVGTFNATPADADGNAVALPAGASTPAYTVTDAAGADQTTHFTLNINPDALGGTIQAGNPPQQNVLDGVGFVMHVDSVKADGATHLDGDTSDTPFDVVHTPGEAVRFKLALSSNAGQAAAV